MKFVLIAQVFYFTKIMLNTEPSQEISSSKSKHIERIKRLKDLHAQRVNKFLFKFRLCFRL